MVIKQNYIDLRDVEPEGNNVDWLKMRPMIMPDGTEALVEDVDFEVEAKEPGLAMRLSDGTIMRARLVSIQVLRLDK